MQPSSARRNLNMKDSSTRNLKNWDAWTGSSTDSKILCLNDPENGLGEAATATNFPSVFHRIPSQMCWSLELSFKGAGHKNVGRWAQKRIANGCVSN